MSTEVPEVELVSTVHSLQSFIYSLPASSDLYIDLEGTKLSRLGTIDLITILVHPTNIIRAIDVTTLGQSAFKELAVDGKTLKRILEDTNIRKYFWDVRNDADALWAHYQVDLRNIIDVQLSEYAARPRLPKPFIRGLAPCIEYDLDLAREELLRWKQIKESITKQMSDGVFEKRPLPREALEYCVNDVRYLPRLHQRYWMYLPEFWHEKVKQESRRRVEEAHSPAYDPNSPAKRKAPWEGFGRK